MFTNIPKIDEESYSLLVESVKEYAIFIIDVNGYITSWNRGAEQIKGYTTNEILGEHISIFYTTEEIANSEPESNLQRAKAYGRFETEGWRLRKDGTLFWASVVFTVLKNDKGELVGFGKVTKDETARKKAAEFAWWPEQFPSLWLNLSFRGPTMRAQYGAGYPQAAM